MKANLSRSNAIIDTVKRLEFIKTNIYYLVKRKGSDEHVKDFFLIYDCYYKKKRLDKAKCKRIEEIYNLTKEKYEEINFSMPKYNSIQSKAKRQKQLYP